MKYAIIAAGEGSRLQQEGVALPKPLVKLRGEAMIDRLLRIFRNNGAEEIVVIVNRLNPLTEHHLRELQAQGLADDVRLVVKTTPSSMHSFAELAPYLGDGPFCLTTVDTIFRETEFADYIRHFQQTALDGCMAVTDYIDDEILSILTSHHMTTVELGIQSTDDAVLAASRRGHDSVTSERACRDVKAAGLELVGQMMTGLPGADVHHLRGRNGFIALGKGAADAAHHHDDSQDQGQLLHAVCSFQMVVLGSPSGRAPSRQRVHLPLWNPAFRIAQAGAAAFRKIPHWKRFFPLCDGRVAKS